MPEILKALNEIMKGAASVKKGGTNAFHGYTYASEADVLAVFRPEMVKAGLILLPNITGHWGPDEHGNTTVEISYTLAHISGEVWPEKLVCLGCGNDRNKNGVGDKGIPKAITSCNKYLLFKLFQISTGDDSEKDGEETPVAADQNLTTVVVNGSLTPIASGTHPLTVVPFKSPAQESHEKVALGVQTVEAFLPLAKTALELDNYYIANKDTIEGHIKKVDPGAYKDLLDKFKKRKTELKA